MVFLSKGSLDTHSTLIRGGLKKKIETMEQNYYTADEAMAILEPRIRAMFKIREERKDCDGIA